MIDGEKRRKVAHTLRQLDNVVDDEPMSRTIAHDATILAMIRDATVGLDGSIFQRLADLIDRPTCRNIADYTKESFKCSRCGCRVLVLNGDSNDVLVVTSEAFPVDWYSCPVCGAEVVEDEY